ncbi:MAG: Mpo1 family 2-hydroxy fatty acid dioxygenase [Vulcanimicrobiaceae bacterium]
MTSLTIFSGTVLTAVIEDPFDAAWADPQVRRRNLFPKVPGTAAGTFVAASAVASTVWGIEKSMTKSALFSEYADYHQDSRNRACHAVGIPLIVLGLLGLLSLARIGPVDLAVVAAIVVLLYYATLSVRGALISAVIFIALYEIAIHLPFRWEVSLAAFVLGWGFQLVGHRFEGNKPKFLTNLTYLLIGPLFFFEEAFGFAFPTKRAT